MFSPHSSIYIYVSCRIKNHHVAQVIDSCAENTQKRILLSFYCRRWSSSTSPLTISPNKIHSYSWFFIFIICSCIFRILFISSTFRNPLLFFFIAYKISTINKTLLFFFPFHLSLCRIASENLKRIVAEETRVSVGIFITNVHSSHILTVHTLTHTHKRRSLLFHDIVITNLLHFGVFQLTIPP